MALTTPRSWVGGPAPWPYRRRRPVRRCRPAAATGRTPPPHHGCPRRWSVVGLHRQRVVATTMVARSRPRILLQDEGDGQRNGLSTASPTAGVAAAAGPAAAPPAAGGDFARGPRGPPTHVRADQQRHRQQPSRGENSINGIMASALGDGRRSARAAATMAGKRRADVGGLLLSPDLGTDVSRPGPAAGQCRR